MRSYMSPVGAFIVYPTYFSEIVWHQARIATNMPLTRHCNQYAIKFALQSLYRQGRIAFTMPARPHCNHYAT